MKIKSAVCYSLSLPVQEPMAYFRLIAPFRQSGIRIINGIQNGRVALDLIREGDIVVVQREFPKRFDEYQKVAQIARQEEKPLVFELDDLMFFLPDSHPDKLNHSFVSALLPMLQVLLEADVVVVSTTELRDALKDYNENIVVSPNYLDDNLWTLRSPARTDNETLTIGYMGTNSHKPDLEYIAPVLLRLVKRYPQNVRFRFWGPKPPESLRTLSQVEWLPFFSHSYEKFAAYFQTQQVDIFIAPLVDNLFNRCKSPIKFFEYSALGAPGVYSRLAPYESVIKHGYNGLLATTLDEWEEYLGKLIEDGDMRLRLATQAQATIKEQWLLSRNASLWLKMFGNDLKVEKREIGANPMLNMLKSLNVQQVGAFQSLMTQVSEQIRKIQSLTVQVDEQEQTIQRLEVEILSYVMSRSWRMTRLLRKIGRKQET